MHSRTTIKQVSDFADLIRTRRRETRISQEMLSSLTGIAQPNLSNIERGAQGTSLETYLRIFSALGIDLVAEVRS